MLSDKHRYERDAHIQFYEENHVYVVHGSSDYTSVTTVIHHAFPVFQGTRIAKKMVNNPKFPSAARYKKYRKIVEGKTEVEAIQAVLKSWEENASEASALGTALHNDIENFYNGIEVKNTSTEYKYFKQFEERKRQQLFLPYRTEWTIYDEDLRIAGSVDMLYTRGETRGGKPVLAMVDWKRSRKIKTSNFLGSGIGCMIHEDDCNFVHYSLQLNMYKYILEKRYNVLIESMHIVIFHPNNSTYKEMEISERHADIENLFLDHAREHRLKVK